MKKLFAAILVLVLLLSSALWKAPWRQSGAR